MIVQSFAHFEITSTFITDWQAHGSASEDRLRFLRIITAAPACTQRLH